MVDFHPENTLREEMLTVFSEMRSWEQELNELALALASIDEDVETTLHEELLQRYCRPAGSF